MATEIYFYIYTYIANLVEFVGAMGGTVPLMASTHVFTAHADAAVLICKITGRMSSPRTDTARSLALTISVPAPAVRTNGVPMARMSLDRCPTTSVQMATWATTSLDSPGDNRSASSRVRRARISLALGQASPHILRMEGQPGK